MKHRLQCQSCPSTRWHTQCIAIYQVSYVSACAATKCGVVQVRLMTARWCVPVQGHRKFPQCVWSWGRAGPWVASCWRRACQSAAICRCCPSCAPRRRQWAPGSVWNPPQCPPPFYLKHTPAWGTGIIARRENPAANYHSHQQSQLANKLLWHFQFLLMLMFWLHLHSIRFNHTVSKNILFAAQMQWHMDTFQTREVGRRPSLLTL